MIFSVDDQTLQTDLKAFLSLTNNRQAWFDAASDVQPSADHRVNARQRRLHPDRCTMRFCCSTLSPNGLLFCNLQTETGAAAPFRPGQQARVFCGAVSYPVFLSSSPARAAEGYYLLGISPEAQPETYSFFESLQPGVAVTLRAPAGTRYFQPLRDGARLLFFADPEGLPAAAAFAAFCPPGGGTEIAFYCVGCVPEPFFDERFRIIDPSALPEALPADTVCFVCGSETLCAAVKKHPSFARARYLSARQPRRTTPLGKTFSCTLITAGGTLVFPCDSDVPLLASLESAGVRVPANCSEGECGFCRCRLLAGSVTAFDPPEADPRRRADAARGVFHSCRVFPDSDLTVAF